MYSQVDKSKENTSQAVANVVGQKKSNVKQRFGFMDNRTCNNKKQFVIQRELDQDLQLKLQHDGYKGPMNGQYMSWTGENKNDKDVDWKAHIGAAKKDKKTVIEKVSPILIGYKMSHKFDINDTDILDKLVTIYPPSNENDWAIILKALDDALSGVATIHEKTSKPVLSSGKIGMRHGQINALTYEHIKQAGIVLKETKREVVNQGEIVYYDVETKEKLWESQEGDLAWVSFMGAFFFLNIGRPQAAVLWDGLLRSDPRSEWNPFGIKLPERVETKEEAETKNSQFLEQLQTEKKKSDKDANIRASYYSKLFSLGILKRP
ncbi:hypothetical protein [Desulfoluna butyratoxydans]|uniref:Uncharacterized protein n=1 Tax=Desulfoluna butyratoxydans TaxID=231438 RepID=A0A4U8YNK8_9BACT|nr:hypothetical protein [Desulfoluna butyratoxydans]VFQ45341.1 hypothetical protein MSL71_29980 [Desulfoluna butyratoxydans]